MKNPLSHGTLDKIYELRNDLEKYLAIVDEHIITSKTDLQGNITYVSKAFEIISGYTKEELLGKSHNIIKHQDTDPSTIKLLWKTIQDGNTWSGELKNKRKNGTAYWVKATITPYIDYKGNHTGYTSIRQDISDRKTIEKISLTDELTGLYNRRYFNQIIKNEICKHINNKDLLCFIICDIDHFKNYNDNYGHQKGDIVLKAVSKFFQYSLRRSSDMVFRLGGEEFGILYSTRTIKDSIEIAKNLCNGIEKMKIKHQHSHVSNYITASFGLLICDCNKHTRVTLTQDKIYKLADDALYKAKQNGKNQIFIKEI